MSNKANFILVHSRNKKVATLVNIEDISVVYTYTSEGYGRMYLKSDPKCGITIYETPEQVMELIKEAYGQE